VTRFERWKLTGHDPESGVNPPHQESKAPPAPCRCGSCAECLERNFRYRMAALNGDIENVMPLPRERYGASGRSR
jgi:hypothetical protein